MKEIVENTKNADPKLWDELNEVLKKYEFLDVYIESIRLRKGDFNPMNCRKVCRRWTNPRTGEIKVVCTWICD